MPLGSLLTLESLVKDSPILGLHSRWQAGLTIAPDDLVVVPDGIDPLQWLIPNHNGRFSPDWPSKRLADFPAKKHAIACSFEYYQCLSNNRPAAHIIEQKYQRMTRHYMRLLLPVSGKIVYAFRRLVAS